jgi:hypothetical protein
MNRPDAREPNRKGRRVIARGERGGLLGPDEVAEEEGDHEDHQQDLREHEENDADPEAHADFLFEVHRAATLSKKLGATVAS